MRPEGTDQKSGDEIPGLEVPFGSNEVRLSIWQWLIASMIVLVILVCLPVVWTAVEPFNPGPDYRIPHALSNDYWIYTRLVRKAVRKGRILIIGDSVIWGEYVAPNQTLSQALNEESGSRRFVNGGVDGTHPLALEGLVRYYAGELGRARVFLHCNLLWMSSPERDLQRKMAIGFNHPRLLPQLTRGIPAYKASVSRRLGVVFDRLAPFRRWVNHIRATSFENLDLHTWSIEHPYKNPLERIELRLPAPSMELRHRPISWTQRGIDRQDLRWIKLDTSLQWHAFQKTVVLLQKRRNHVFVLVGPFNEHMLTQGSLQRYHAMKRQVQRWLKKKQIAFNIPPPLPSDEYADASHPLSAGYARLAANLYKSSSFRDWLGE